MVLTLKRIKLIALSIVIFSFICVWRYSKDGALERISKFQLTDGSNFQLRGEHVMQSSSNLSFTIGEEEMLRLFKNMNSSIKHYPSCESLFNNNQAVIDMAKNITKRDSLQFKKYMTLLRKCSKFREQRGYLTSSFTREEEEFPIAYSIVMYKAIEQTERLLRAIYRPQNIYCIHVDASATRATKVQARALARCFRNVFIPKDLVNVVWGKFSVLEAELNCLKELWHYKKWKYFINLTGQEFPLKTNLELVKILKALKGASLSDGSAEDTRVRNRHRFAKAGPPPHGIQPVKGIVHAALSRAFVDFVLHDNRSIDFIDWLKNTTVPDETLFPTLNHSPHLGIPGTFTGDVEVYPMKPQLIRYKNKYLKYLWQRPCGGRNVRNVCVMGVADLHRLVRDFSLFVNKLFLGYQPVTFECMEQYIQTKTRQQYLEGKEIDVHVYEQLDQVKLRLIKS